MYEYTPKFEKKREKLLAIFVIGLSVIVYAISATGLLPFPGIFQMLAVCGITAGILILTMYVLPHYTYRIEPREEGSGALDFVIVEYTGRRSITVCRVSVSSVIEVVCVTKETKATIDQAKKGKHFYNYTGVLFDEVRYCAHLEENGESFFVYFCPDAKLLQYLNQ